MRRLNNIEDKNEEQLKTIENRDKKELGIKSIIDFFDKKPSQEVKDIFIKLNNLEISINYKKLIHKRDRNLEFDFTDYSFLKKIFKEIYYRKISIDRAEDIQKEFANVLDTLERYRPKDPEYIDKRIELLDNAKRFYVGRKIIVDAFKNKIFPLYFRKKKTIKMKLKVKMKVKMYMKYAI